MARRRPPKRKKIPKRPIQHTPEALEAHRELQYLRAASWRPMRPGEGRRKARWMQERSDKLDAARRRNA